MHGIAIASTWPRDHRRSRRRRPRRRPRAAAGGRRLVRARRAGRRGRRAWRRARPSTSAGGARRSLRDGRRGHRRQSTRSSARSSSCSPIAPAAGGEWQDDAGLGLLRRRGQAERTAPILCAGGAPAVGGRARGARAGPCRAPGSSARRRRRCAARSISLIALEAGLRPATSSLIVVGRRAAADHRAVGSASASRTARHRRAVAAGASPGSMAGCRGCGLPGRSRARRAATRVIRSMLTRRRARDRRARRGLPRDEGARGRVGDAAGARRAAAASAASSPAAVDARSGSPRNRAVALMPPCAASRARPDSRRCALASARRPTRARSYAERYLAHVQVAGVRRARRPRQRHRPVSSAPRTTSRASSERPAWSRRRRRRLLPVLRRRGRASTRPPTTALVLITASGDSGVRARPRLPSAVDPRRRARSSARAAPPRRCRWSSPDTASRRRASATTTSPGSTCAAPRCSCSRTSRRSTIREQRLRQAAS